MIWFALFVLFFVAIGVLVIVQRKEIANGMGMLFGASTAPGCALAVAVLCFAVAIAAVVVYQLGLLGDL
jgi:hypothetical protein